MRQDRRFQRKPEDDWKRFLPVIVIPVIAILLIAVILIVDRGRNGRTETAAQSTEQAAPSEASESAGEEPTGAGEEPEDGVETGAENPEEEPGSPEEPAPAGEEPPAEPEPPSILSQDSDPAILALMQRYFNARVDADVEAMNAVYGIADLPAEELEAEQVKMRNFSKYLEGFENIVTYVADSRQENLWLVYTTADIRFLTVSTAAPMIMWCYVCSDGNGVYTILSEDALTDEMLDFVNVANHQQEVRQLASAINTALREALLSDEDLNEVYGVLRDGSPVWDDGESPQEVMIEEEGET